MKTLITITLLIMLTAILISCSTDIEEEKMPEQDKFTWNVQLAGYDFDMADKKGETVYSKFITEFENFPWMNQLDEFQKIQSGCSPTMSVKDLKTGKDFWVSMGGDRNNHGYLIGYIYPKEKKGLMGFGKTKTIRWLEIYLTEDQNTVKECFKLFFDRNFESLENKIRLLEEYEQMESKDSSE